tara:strand:- start:1310 stop:1660 length:351 start_codon:yes stop_codon:yes gene_type:complete
MVNSIDSIEDLEIEVDVPIEALEDVDLDLPDDFTDEMFAQEVLDNVVGYHRSETARKAAKHQGEDEQVEQFRKQAQICKAAAALIQYEHPNTKVIYKQIASIRATQIRANRDSLME